jgi:hypothetical protein
MGCVWRAFNSPYPDFMKKIHFQNIFFILNSIIWVTLTILGSLAFFLLIILVFSTKVELVGLAALISLPFLYPASVFISSFTLEFPYFISWSLVLIFLLPIYLRKEKLTNKQFIKKSLSYPLSIGYLSVISITFFLLNKCQAPLYCPTTDHKLITDGGILNITLGLIFLMPIVIFFISFIIKKFLKK